MTPILFPKMENTLSLSPDELFLLSKKHKEFRSLIDSTYIVKDTKKNEHKRWRAFTKDMIPLQVSIEIDKSKFSEDIIMF